MIVKQDHPGAGLRDAVMEILTEQAEAAGHPFNKVELGFEVREGGELRGGLLARITSGWMFVEMLGVREEARGQGWGRKLLAAAEAEARARGLTGLWLDTYTFQAPDFYRAQGYEEFGRIDDYPAGHARVFFTKRLK